MEKIKNMIENFPRKLMRRFFGIFAVCGLSLAVFSPSLCYAEATNSEQNSLQKQEDFNNEIRSVINMISQIVYIFLWPLLVIAWTALDNTLVYGKFLNLDAALWDIRNIMKNIANFALWFVFVFAIVKNLFKSSFWDGNPMKDAVDVVKKTLISGVLVQMSWFILGTLLDLSTILIYAVWWLPLSMLGSYNTDLASVPIMELHTSLDENNGWNFYYYYSYWEHNFSPCFTIDNESSAADLKLDGYNWKYIAWRYNMYLSGDKEFDSWYCVLYGYPYKYQESSDFLCPAWATALWCYSKPENKTVSELNADYRAQLKSFISNLTGDAIADQEQKCFLIGAYGTWCQLDSDTWTHYWAMSFTWDIFASAERKLDSLLESSKWWVWPLITMYSSILKVQDLLVNPGNTSTMSSLFWAIINTFFVAVLFIPIAILAILLIIRIWFLWVVIALSPILVLIRFWPDPINKLKDNKLFEEFTMEKIFRRIFSPIVVVFAVSLSIIFLTTMHASRPDDDNKWFLSAFWIQSDCKWNWPVTDNNGGWENWWSDANNSPENCHYLVSWLVDLKINMSGFNHWKDVFVWCLMMMLSTGIVRFFMKFAINVMGKWGLWEKLMKSSEEFLKSVPVVPLPGGGAIGINKIKDIWLSKRLDAVTTKMTNASEELLQERFPWAYWITESPEEKTAKQVNSVLDEVRSGKVTNYDALSTEQKELVNTYYWNEAAAKQVINNIYTYNTDNSVQTTIQNAITQEMKNGTHTSADALKLWASELNIAVQNDSTWKDWAQWMIWWAVHTRDGVYIVDIIPWTENHPVYEILSRNDYEERHFPGNNLEAVDLQTYTDNKAAIDKYLAELKEELEKLTALQNKQNRTPQEQDLLVKLQQLQSDLTSKTYIDQIKTQLGLQ